MVSFDDSRFVAVRIALIDLFDEMRRLHDESVAFPPSAGVSIPTGQPIDLGDDSVAEVHAPNLVVRFVDDDELFRPLVDLHGIAARAHHRSWHACAEAIASWRIARRSHQSLIPSDFLLRRFRQWKRGSPATSGGRLTRFVVRRPDAGEIRVLSPRFGCTDDHHDDGHGCAEPESRPHSVHRALLQH
jgi:hypothetical protein